MLIGDLIIVRHRGKSHIGMLQAFSKMKIKIATSANRVIDISARHIIYSTNINIENLSGMTTVRYKLEKLAESFNLEEVWNILKEDRSTVYTSNEIGDLYWGAPPSNEEKAAMLLHLCNHSIYFSESDSRFKPRTAEELRILTQKSNQQQNEIAKNMWDNTKLLSRKCYLTSKDPSSFTTIPEDGIPDHLKGTEPQFQESEKGFKNFTVIENKIDEIDWLYLEIVAIAIVGIIAILNHKFSIKNYVGN